MLPDPNEDLDYGKCEKCKGNQVAETIQYTFRSSSSSSIFYKNHGLYGHRSVLSDDAIILKK